MADLTVGGIGAQKVDESKWKKLTPQEIIKEESNGAEIPSEILLWAQQMAAFAQIPDDVTYEQVDGDVGLDALSKLGLEEEKPVGAEDNNAVAPEKTEEPDAVKDVAQPEDIDEENPENNIFMNPLPGQAADTINPEEKEDNKEAKDKPEELTLADASITTNPEEIRKRKERKGLA
jgi:hypothetical protein